jgi:Tfp pilus assembly protein PilV
MLIGQKGRETGALRYLHTSLLKKRGLSLIEVFVSSGILSLLLAALFIGLTSGQLSSTVSSAKADLQGKLRLIMAWIVKDVRQTDIIEINSNVPSVDHLKFKKVTGIDNITGNYTVGSDYTEYNYNSTSGVLTRSEINGSTGAIQHSVPFNNITQSPFYTAPAVPLVVGGILNSKKLIIVIAGETRVRNSLTLNLTLTEEAKIRNE